MLSSHDHLFLAEGPQCGERLKKERIRANSMPRVADPLQYVGRSAACSPLASYRRQVPKSVSHCSRVRLSGCRPRNNPPTDAAVHANRTRHRLASSTTACLAPFLPRDRDQTSPTPCRRRTPAPRPPAYPPVSRDRIAANGYGWNAKCVQVQHSVWTFDDDHARVSQLIGRYLTTKDVFAVQFQAPVKPLHEPELARFILAVAGSLPLGVLFLEVQIPPEPRQNIPVRVGPSVHEMSAEETACVIRQIAAAEFPHHLGGHERPTPHIRRGVRIHLGNVDDKLVVESDEFPCAFVFRILQWRIAEDLFGAVRIRGCRRSTSVRSARDAPPANAAKSSAISRNSCPCNRSPDGP